MAKILLLRPPSVFSRSAFSAPITMPLNLAYLAASLREKNHSVQVLDALGENISHIGVSYSPSVFYRGLETDAILDRISSRTDAIGITTMFSQDWPHIENIISSVRARFPGIPIIVGGEHATATSDYMLSSCKAVDFVALGEGEETMADFADFIDGKKKIEEIPGVRYRGEGGQIAANAARGRIRTPDQLPWPAWDLFNLDPYFAAGDGHGVERGRSMPILATRGCPYQCTFCSNPTMWTTRYVMRDTEKVLDEIDHYMRVYRADNIDFFDLTAIIKKEWILDFCRGIQRRGLHLTWQLPSGTRSEAMDREVLHHMSKTGCTNVTYAPESGSTQTLERIKKKVKLPRLFQSVRNAKAEGIFVKCNLIIGFPHERRRNVWATLWTAVKLALMGVDDIPLYAYSPYPGSELYAYLRSTGKIPEMTPSYFESLMTFMDLKTKTIYCENIGPREISFYRIFGMSLAYLLTYLRHPSRVLRTWRNYRQGKSDTVFEERFFSFLKRKKQARHLPPQADRPEPIAIAGQG